MADDRIQKIYQAVEKRVLVLLKPDRFYITLFDRVKSQLEFPRVWGDGADTWPARLLDEARIPDQVLLHKEYKLYADEAAERIAADGLNYWPEGAPFVSWLGMPIMIGGKVLGAMVVESQVPDAFEAQRAVGLLANIAGQTATALENARLVESLDAVNRIGQELNGQIRRSEAQILDLIHKEAAQLLHAENMYIALYDSATDMVSFPVMYVGGEPSQTPARKVNRDALGKTEEIILTKKHLFHPTKAGSAAWYREPGHQEFWGNPFGSWIGVPMIVHDQVIGVIAAYHENLDDIYDEKDLQLLQSMANQAAVALDNARVYKELAKTNQELNESNEKLAERTNQLEALQDIGVNITKQLDVKEVLASIAESAVGLLDADFVTLFFYNSNLDEFAVGIRKGSVAEQPVLPSSDSQAYELVNSNIPLYVDEIEDKEDSIKVIVEGKRSFAYAGVPLFVGDKAIGLMYVNYFDPHIFLDPEKEIISMLANQAAVAIENANLYQELKLAYQELEEIQEQKLWAEIGRTAGSLAHRIGNKGGLIRVAVADLFEEVEALNIMNERITSRLELIQRNNQYLLEMSDLLFKPVEAREKSLVDSEINLLLSDAFRSVNISESVEVKIDKSVDALPKVPSSRSFVEIFVEIINNALEAMTTSSVKRITISGRLVNNFVELDFADTGPGIVEAEQDMIFDLFTRIPLRQERNAGHRGFGLWWVKSFLASIGGDIICKSSTGKGTVFTVRLPLNGEYHE